MPAFGGSPVRQANNGIRRLNDRRLGCGRCWCLGCGWGGRLGGESDHRRSVFLRVCPESCPEYRAFFGLREDSESINSTHKRQLDDDRVRYKGRIRNRLHLIANRQNENDKNMYGYLIRRGDMAAYRRRFTYKPIRWEDTLPKAA